MAAPDEPHRRLEPVLRRLLRQLAADRGARPQDLSARCVEACREAVLEAYRLGTEHGEITGEWDRLVER